MASLNSIMRTVLEIKDIVSEKSQAGRISKENVSLKKEVDRLSTLLGKQETEIKKLNAKLKKDDK